MQTLLIFSEVNKPTFIEPPKVARRFLKWYCKAALFEEISGDIEEDFNKRVYRKGMRYAQAFYWLDVLSFLRPFAIKHLFKTQINLMFLFNSKLALRNLAKHKLYSVINISGLALGIAVCLVIAHYVQFQLSFDQDFEHSDHLYRVHTTRYQNGKKQQTTFNSPFGLGHALRQDMPDFAKLSLVHPYEDGAVITRADDSKQSVFLEPDILFVEPDFIEMFSLKFLAGSPTTALNAPMNIVLTKSAVQKYFDKDYISAVGKTLSVEGGWGRSGKFIISGVIEDFPSNSHISFDFLLPISNVLNHGQYENPDAAWSWNNFSLYVQTNDQSDFKTTAEKLAPLMRTYRGDILEKYSRDAVLSMQPIGDIYLKSAVEKDAYGSMNSVYFMIAIGVLIIMIAWINFINLSTAKASERGREVGVKKVMGADRKSLIWQFLTESFWINFFALVLGLLIAYVLIPELGHIIDEELRLNLLNQEILLLTGIILLSGPFLAGFYPAFFMSGMNTVSSLKGNKGTMPQGRSPLRKVLLISQFTISTLMLIGTFVVWKQLEFLRNQNTGIEMDNILVVKGPTGDSDASDVEKFRNDLKTLSSVKSVTSSRSIPGAPYNWGTGMTKMGAEQSTRQGVEVTFVDHEFFQTYDIELLAGMDFSEATKVFPNEDDTILKNGVIINEATLKAFDLGSPEEALNEKLIISSYIFFVRGVMEDHNWKSLHSPITPGVFMFTPSNNEYFSLRIHGSEIKETLEQIEGYYKATFTNTPLDYFFLNDFFDKHYKSDREFGQIFSGFALFAVIAACLGLFGLTAFSILQKAKEIGIRKVLGARMTHITYLFSKNYLSLILIANLLAMPVAYYGIQYWLQDYAYQIPVSPILFIAPILLLVFIALATICFQTIKVAYTNPVSNLRSE